MEQEQLVRLERPNFKGERASEIRFFQQVCDSVHHFLSKELCLTFFFFQLQTLEETCAKLLSTCGFALVMSSCLCFFVFCVTRSVALASLFF